MFQVLPKPVTFEEFINVIRSRIFWRPKPERLALT